MILQTASKSSPIYCEFSEIKNLVSPSLSRFAANTSSHGCRGRERRTTKVGWNFFQAQACIGGGNAQPHSGEAGTKSIVLKRLSGEEESSDSASLFRATESSSGNSYHSNIGQDPIGSRPRNQLGGVHPFPTPPWNRFFYLLLAFVFFVGVVFDKVWTYRTINGARDEHDQSDSLPLTRKRISKFLEKDLQRKETVEWVNMVLGKLWRVYGDDMEKRIVGLLQPAFDKLKRPHYLQRVEIKQFSLGDEALSVRNVERRTSRSDNDLQYQIGLRYAGGARMLLHLTLKFGIFPVIVPVGIRNLDVDGELWVDVRLINKQPYVGSVSWAFVSLPKIKFDLSAFRFFNVMAIPILSRFLKKFLTRDLPKLFVRPKKIVIDFQKPKGAETEIMTDETSEGDKGFTGELSVTLLDTFYVKNKDPYFVLRLGDQEISCKQKKEHDFYLLVSDPTKEKLCVEVKDSLGFTDVTLGKAEVDLGSLPDTVSTVRIVRLQGSLWGLLGNDGAGEVLMRLTYKARVGEDDEQPKEVHANNTEEQCKDSFVGDVTSMLVRDEFQGIMKSEQVNTEALDDGITDPNIGENKQISANSQGSTLFWLVVVSGIAVVLAAITYMGSSNLFYH